MKHIVFTVTNDLSQDQRMNRICASLANAGYKITIIGQGHLLSEPLTDKPFAQVRLRCFFRKGKLFYIEYNLKLLLFLLRLKYDVICGIDLDTLFPAFIASKIGKKILVYDAHEYFTEMEEVVTRPLIKYVWQMLERIIIPRVKYAYTVSDGYAELFDKKYGIKFDVIKNATVLRELPEKKPREKYILYQGAVNVGRGLECLLGAMQFVNGKLYICGRGNIYDDLTVMARRLGVENKVSFFGFVEPEKLKEYTLNATIGITLFVNKGLSNHYSLANRFFDYLHAGVPQIAMNYPEYAAFNKKYEVALLIAKPDVQTINNAIERLYNDTAYYMKLQKNCFEARKEYCWQNEEKKLLGIYTGICYPATTTGGSPER